MGPDSSTNTDLKLVIWYILVDTRVLMPGDSKGNIHTFSHFCVHRCT